MTKLIGGFGQVMSVRGGVSQIMSFSILGEPLDDVGPLLARRENCYGFPVIVQQTHTHLCSSLYWLRTLVSARHLRV